VNKVTKKELIKEFKNILEARNEIEDWIWRYNYKRVHQGLGASWFLQTVFMAR